LVKLDRKNLKTQSPRPTAYHRPMKPDESDESDESDEPVEE
jgi:hypothetical protein